MSVAATDRLVGRAVDPRFDLVAADLHELAHLLPPSAADLVRAVGQDAAAALMHRLAGVQLQVPRHRNANPAGARRWAQLEAVIGDAATEALARNHGGEVLDVPTCLALLVEKRNRWLRARFDWLTSSSGPGLPMSGRAAVYEIGIELVAAGRGMTYRQIERVLQEPGRHGAAAEQQLDLFRPPRSPASSPSIFPTPATTKDQPTWQPE
ncbi:MAG: hypothetical protein MUF08_00580 [Burkholderiaceae bacterium]|nr:hypothetical protein [Burkholderiaceae bacterium]